MKKYIPLAAFILIFGFSFAHAQTACFSDSDCGGGTCDTTTDTCMGGTNTYGSTGIGGSNTSGLGIYGSTDNTGSGFPTPNSSALEQYATLVIDFINELAVPLIISVAFLLFLWGVADAYILHPGNADKRKEGHQFIMWAIIGFVVIFSVWGLVNLVGTTLGLGGQTHPSYPTL